ncbi:hypothetical protein QOZ80_2BG0199220 [Eleusine coracana subsp. coracana]|nr:hypothetical protein QOZ80_2BG0199220 [Eleusine coracana subsp. coracana]
MAKRHVYLVLSDWELGYSVRKLDLSVRSEDSNSNKQRLPPAVFRLEAPHGRSGLFAAFGTKIMFLGTRGSPWGSSAPMFDVRTRSLASIPMLESEPNPYSCAYFQVDGKFFVLDDTNFEMLQCHPASYDGAGHKRKMSWSWLALPEPSYQHVESYALHPDGRTMFFSMIKLTQKFHPKMATFRFDPETSQWTRHGAWGLPFKGRGFFDCDLDAWVGLPATCSDPNTLGHICACDVLSSTGGDNDKLQPPDLYKGACPPALFWNTFCGDELLVRFASLERGGLRRGP